MTLWHRDGVTVDYVINNAGVSGPVTCFANAPLDEFKSTVGIHLTGTFWGSVQALRVMKEGGKIITISDVLYRGEASGAEAVTVSEARTLHRRGQRTGWQR